VTHRRSAGPARRRSRSLIVVAVLVLIVASCASAPTDPAADAVHDQGRRFAACMRDNGAVAFPDPDADGELTIDGIANGSGLDPSTREFAQALEACDDLRPAGFFGQEDLSPEQLEGRLEFARCIRENGVPDFPDPAPDAPLVDTNRIPSAATERGMGLLDAAMQACRDVGAKALGDE
jgi:hypothetical protein